MPERGLEQQDESLSSGGHMRARAEAIRDEMVRLRRDIHQYPELGFQEVRTAALVAETLAEIGGMEIRTGVGRTGVVADLGSGGPTIAIRADMDALPIAEKNDVAYRSQNDGVMHACGHDAHVAILLGTAHLLRQSAGGLAGARASCSASEEAFDDDGISGRR